MQSLRAIRALRAIRPQHLTTYARFRALSTTPSAPTPWFVDQDEETPTFNQRPTPPHLPSEPYKLPSSVPDAVRLLYNELSTSPYLEPSTLIAREPLQIPAGPPLPERKPRGKRRRGGTFAGESEIEESGGIWSWIVMAQVKEGTEHRGAIESVVRIVRRTLLKVNPPLPLPPNSKQRMHNGWAMIDAGNFAVHIMSKDARQKYFEDLENRAAAAEW